MNRYYAVKFSGNPLLSLLKRFAWGVMRRPRVGVLGAGSYVVRPFTCPNPESVSIGRRVTIGAHCNAQVIKRYYEQHFNPLVCIGDDCYIGEYCQLHSVNAIRIGNACVISDHVHLTDVAHGLDPMAGHILDQALSSKGPVTIGDSCFIGFGATVLPAVTLGSHCVVGARSVVTRSFPDYSMIVGNPAQCVAVFDPILRQWRRVKDRSTVPAPR